MYLLHMRDRSLTKTPLRLVGPNMRCSRLPRGTGLGAAGILAAVVVACGDPQPARSLEDSGRSGADAVPQAPSATGRTYQRTIVFFDTSQDTTMFVPWDFENRSQPGGVARTLRGWLGRGGEWALFAEDEWITAPSRVPWRILPRGPVRLVVDTDDVMRTVVYREGLRDLTVDIGQTQVEWRGQRGGGMGVAGGIVAMGRNAQLRAGPQAHSRSVGVRLRRRRTGRERRSHQLPSEDPRRRGRDLACAGRLRGSGDRYRRRRGARGQGLPTTHPTVTRRVERSA